MAGPSKTFQERNWRRAQLWKLGLKAWEYDKFLEGPHWQELRKQKLEEQRSRLGYNCCEKCGERQPVPPTRETALHLHHLTYERLGEERLEDVLVICPHCHKKEHAGDGKPDSRGDTAT
jgi:hypothetical protein